MKIKDVKSSIIIVLFIALICALNSAYQTNKLLTEATEAKTNTINLAEVSATVTTSEGIYLYTEDGNYYIKH